MDFTKKQGVENIVLESFAFLEIEKGFNLGTRINRGAGKQGGWVTKILFRSIYLGIEIDIDYFEHLITMLFVPLIQGEIPLNLDNHKIKWGTGEYLEATLQVKDPLWDDIRLLNKTDIHDIHYVNSIVAIYRGLLVKYIDKVIFRNYGAR